MPLTAPAQPMRRMLAAAEKGDDLPIGALGSGSDYSSFLQHLGLPALNIGYGGEDESAGVLPLDLRQL